MIPLSKILEIGKRRRAAVACDAADDEICTAEDPAKCRVHGIRRYEREGDYLDKLAHASEEQKKAEAVVNYFQNIANSMTMEEVDSVISSAFKTVLVSKEDALKEKGLSLGERELLSYVFEENVSDKLPTEKEIAQTKRCVAATIKHLKEKHGIDYLNSCALVIRWQKEENRGGAFIVGGVDGDENNSCIVFAINKKAKGVQVSFHHGDYRDDFDYFRHEIGHLVAHVKGISDGELYEDLVSGIGEESAEAELKKVSKYAYDSRTEGDAEAECFSKFTDNGYDSSMHKAIENFIEAMIGGKKK